MQIDRKIRQEAADWFIIQRRGAMTLEERQAFDAWRSHPMHQTALNHAHEAWGELAAIKDGAASYPQRKGGMRQGRVLGALAASLAIGLIGVASLGIMNRFTAPVLQTGIGEQSTKELSDGSVVALNVVSNARYDFNAAKRVIDLNQGEATFLVQKDPDRPFLVKSGGYEVRAIGTAFNVRNRDQRLEIAVKEGLVEVRHPSSGFKPVFLRAGQRFQVSLHKSGSVDLFNVSTVSKVSVDEWRHRVLSYENAPIQQVIRDVNLFYDRPVTVDPGQGSRRVTLRVQIEDRAETIKRLSVLLDTPVKDASLRNAPKA